MKSRKGNGYLLPAVHDDCQEHYAFVSVARPTHQGAFASVEGSGEFEDSPHF
jgi:hypothetical protein